MISHEHIESSSGADTEVSLRALQRDDRDARRYLISTLVLTLTMYAAVGAAAFGAIAPWWLFAVVPLIYFRLALGLHELLHARSADEVPLFHQLGMIFETPLCLGFREHRAIHFAHHRFAGTARDPELYQIIGGHLRAFACAMACPECSLVLWVREHGVSASLLTLGAIRLAGFVTLAVLAPRAFFIYWIALRLSVGVASYVFHHVLHSLDGELGTFPFPVADRIVRAAGLLFGREPLMILTEHERHHAWPRVRARDLPMLPEPRA